MTQTADAVVRRQIVVDALSSTPYGVHRTIRRLQAGRAQSARRTNRQDRIRARVGGHIYDRATDGSECRWARVLAYEPPDRVVFSWDISPQWELESALENTSEVEVRFTADTPNRTRVDLEHRNIDRHGPGWEAVSLGVSDDAGWPLYLDRYAALFTKGG